MSFSELREYFTSSSGKDNIPIVVIEKVEKEAPVRLGEAIYRVLSSCGASQLLDRWKHNKILLKPNCCRLAEYGQTTSIQALDATISILKDYSCKIIFGDGMTQAFLSPERFKQVSAQLLKITRKHNIEFAHFDESRDDRYAVESNGFNFYLPAWIKEIAGMINLAVLKVHPQMVGSFAVKNHMGLLSGSDRLELHRTGIAEGIWRLQSCLGKAVPQQIHIVDGLISFQRYRPSSSYERPNLIIGGLNPCAVDFACAKVMGIDPKTQFPQYRVALQNGFGYGIHIPINFLGANIEDVKFQCHIPEQILEPPSLLPSIRIRWGEFDYPLNQSLKDLFRAMDSDMPIDIYVGGAAPTRFEKGRLCVCLGNASVNSSKHRENQVVAIEGDPPAGTIFASVADEIKMKFAEIRQS